MNKIKCIEELLEVIEGEHKILEEAKEALVSKVKCHKLEAGKSILKEGDVSSKMFFLNSGLIRTHYLNESGDDITSSFVQKKEFFTNVFGFNNLKPSTETITVLENSIFCSVSKEDYIWLMQTYSDLSIMSHFIINQHRIELDERVRMLQNLSAKERYQSFVKNYPELVTRLQNKHIASFLGIRLETLSRIIHKK